MCVPIDVRVYTAWRTVKCGLHGAQATRMLQSQKSAGTCLARRLLAINLHSRAATLLLPATRAMTVHRVR